MVLHNVKTAQFPKNRYSLNLSLEFFKSCPVVREGAKKIGFLNYICLLYVIDELR